MFICDGKPKSCFSCPYPDCIRDTKKAKQTKRRKDRREYYRKYYQAHREEMLAKSAERYRNKKAI